MERNEIHGYVIKMDEKEKMRILKEKFGITQIGKLAMHDDADGISSGVLLTYVFKTAEVVSPDIFGEVGDANVCVDMRPLDPKWTGLCFDHHPDHPEEKDRSYKLVWGDEPATKIIYDLFKDFLEPHQHWKMAIGTCGDGRPEIVPKDIWQRFPMLLSKVQSVYERGTRLNLYPMPLYMKVVSGLNSCCKIPGKWYTAYSVLRTAEDPLDIIHDDAVNLAGRLVSEERKRVVRDFPIIDLSDYIRVWPIESEYKIERGLAWRANEVDQKTSIVINKKTRALSIRGVLAGTIYEELSKMGYEVGGHPGFGGGLLKEEQDYKTLMKDLKKIKI